MKPRYMNKTRGCVINLENVIETLKAMDSTIRAKSVEMSKMSDMIGERDKVIAELHEMYKKERDERIRAQRWGERLQREYEAAQRKPVPIMPAPNDYHRLNGE